MGTANFQQLLVNNTEYLKPFAFTLTRDNEQAQDLLQETLYRALANKDKYNVGTNLKAWLYTIMRNIFINNYRKKVKQQQVFQQNGTDYLLDSHQSAVANDAMANLSIKEVKEAIAALPDIFKTPFVLYFEGYKYNEIAEIMQEPLGTIKSRIHFARKLLKAQIDR